MTNGRSKGKRFELDVCEVLARAWYPDKYSPGVKIHAEDNPFRRTPNSGAWTGLQGALRGDVIAPADFPWSVECKCQESWSFDAFMSSKTAPIASWWAQCVAASNAGGKHPLLVFSRNRMGLFAAIEPRLMPPGFADVYARHWPDYSAVLRLDVEDYVTLHVMPFSSLLTTIQEWKHGQKAQETQPARRKTRSTGPVA